LSKQYSSYDQVLFGDILMRSWFKLLERINITQRQAVLVVLALHCFGIALTVLMQLSPYPPENSMLIYGGITAVIVFGTAWFLYYKYDWKLIRYFAALASSILVGLFLPEPFVSDYAPMIIVIPVILAWLVAGPLWMIVNAVLTIAILLIRAGGSGVYAEPVTITLYIMIVSGLLVSRLIAETSIRQFRQAQERIQQQVQKLHGLRTIDTTIVNTFDMKKSLNTLLAEAISQLKVSAASILLFNPSSQMLEYVVGIGFHSPLNEQTHLQMTEGFGGRAARERRTVYVRDLRQAGRDFLNAELLKEEMFVSAYAVPLVVKGELQGVLQVFQRGELQLDPEEQDFLETLAGQAAIAIDNARLFEGLQQSNIDLALAYDATITGWSRAMDLRDKETEGHTQRVTDLTLKLARAMSVQESELTHIRRGALLHDIGKMGIPDNILLKADELTVEEWEKMRKHPSFAYEMLSAIRYLQPALDIPYCHHEKWDGTGYPRGLKAEEIPIAARIFAVVDVWDAITSDRPYRKGWSQEEALKYIKEQSGIFFDPQVVVEFLKLISNQ
jgi:putative nucleotidyltransferase with HDIG domain